MSRQHSSVTLRSFARLRCTRDFAAESETPSFSASSCRFKPSISVRIRASGFDRKCLNGTKRIRKKPPGICSHRNPFTLSRSRSIGTERSSNATNRFVSFRESITVFRAIWNNQPRKSPAPRLSPESAHLEERLLGKILGSRSIFDCQNKSIDLVAKFRRDCFQAAGLKNFIHLSTKTAAIHKSCYRNPRSNTVYLHIRRKVSSRCERKASRPGPGARGCSRPPTG